MHNELLENRIKILDDMIINLGKDIDSLEELSEIMDFSNECINDIKKINLELTKLGKISEHDEKYESKLKIAIDAQTQMINKINNRRVEIVKSMEEIGKRQEILESYVSQKKESIFVDKDL